MTTLELILVIVFGVPFVLVAIPLVIEMVLARPFTVNDDRESFHQKEQ